MSESCGCFNVYSVTFMFTLPAVSLFTLSQVLLAAHAKTYDFENASLCPVVKSKCGHSEYCNNTLLEYTTKIIFILCMYVCFVCRIVSEISQKCHSYIHTLSIHILIGLLNRFGTWYKSWKRTRERERTAGTWSRGRRHEENRTCWPSILPLPVQTVGGTAERDPTSLQGAGGRNSGSPDPVSVCLCLRVWRDVSQCPGHAVSWSHCPTLGPDRWISLVSVQLAAPGNAC